VDFGTFPFVDCASCQTERLAHGELRGEALIYVCFWCGAEHDHARAGDDAALWELGLRIASRPRIEPPMPKKSGCAKGCGSSRAPGAKSEGAGCSTGGGCSSGSCGVPDKVSSPPAAA
jgi:hypothetical protein